MNRNLKVVTIVKILVIIICLNSILYFNVSASHIEYDEDIYEEIIYNAAPYIFDDETENIKRDECIASIVKMIGMNDDIAKSYTQAHFNPPPFSDIIGNEKNAGYIFAAYLPGIAKGDKRGYYENGEFFERGGPFRRFSDVTTKETLAFLLRCLEVGDSLLWENTMDDSVKYDLLNEDELEFYVEEELITEEQFHLLLRRMLDMKRYIYWPKEPMDGSFRFAQYDKERSIVYIDWIMNNEVEKP